MLDSWDVSKTVYIKYEFLMTVIDFLFNRTIELFHLQ